MKISKNRYLQGFGIVVLLLALVRVIFPWQNRKRRLLMRLILRSWQRRIRLLLMLLLLRFLMHRLILKGMWLRT